MRKTKTENSGFGAVLVVMKGMAVLYFALAVVKIHVKLGIMYVVLLAGRVLHAI
jgi:hypothetical protein